MDCQQAQDWLLKSDSPDVSGAPSEIAAHVASCEACGAFAERLRRLDDAVRVLPAPAESVLAKQTFLRTIAAKTAVAERPRPTRRLWPRLAIAAMLFIAGGVGAWLVLRNEDLQNEPRVTAIDDAIDLNRRLTDATSLDARDRFYQEASKRIREQLDQGTLDPDDRDLTLDLLQHGQWLTTHADPAQAAEGFGRLQLNVLLRLRNAANGDQPMRVVRICRHYLRMSQAGIFSNLDAEKLPPRAKARLAFMRLTTRAALLSMLDKVPPRARPDLRRVIELLSQPTTPRGG